MKTKTFIDKRKWINPKSHDDNGWISYNVNSDYGLNAEFMIADCSRTITLNFSTYSQSKKGAMQRADKINTLIEALTEFREALGEAWQYEEDNKEEETEDCFCCS